MFHRLTFIPNQKQKVVCRGTNTILSAMLITYNSQNKLRHIFFSSNNDNEKEIIGQTNNNNAFCDVCIRFTCVCDLGEREKFFKK